MEAKTANAVDAQSARFTWRIEKFSRRKTKKLYSEIFSVGGHKWVVVICPERENYDHLSIYLAVADSETLPNGWSRKIEFGLSVTNHIDNKSTVKKVELTVEAAKTAAAGKGETPKSSSSSQGDIDRDTASVTDAILPQTDTSGLRPTSKSSTEVIKTLAPQTTPLVDKETTVISPMGSPLESTSFDDMDAYISKLVSLVETDAPFDSTTEGLVAASIPQSTIDATKKIFIHMLSWDLSEIPDFSRQFTESISVLSKCCDLKPVQLAELNTLKAEFPTLLKTYQTSNHSLKEVDEKIAEKQGTKKCLVEQVKINAFAFQMQRAIHKDLITKEANLQAALAKTSEKKKSAEKEMKQLHGKMVNLEQSRSSVLEEISTLETEKKTAESTLSSVQQKWTELRHTFMEPNN